MNEKLFGADRRRFTLAANGRFHPLGYVGDPSSAAAPVTCVFYNLASSFQHPAEIFELWKGGMSFHGGFSGR